MPKLSVIVPVYNVAQYIERCARSLFEQTMNDIEFIFVDDCSPDNSIDIIKGILKDYPERINNVFFCYHEENKGLPSARKTGYNQAKGEYIAHCDSDDWVSPNMYETLYEKAMQDNADIVCCDFYKSDGEKKRFYPISDYHGGLLQGPVWNKIAKRGLYKNIAFPKANKAEDGVIMMQLSFFANKISVIHIPLYYYFDNPESICLVPSREACINRWLQECENTDMRIEFLNRNRVADRYNKSIIMMKYYSLTNLIPFLREDEVYRLWKSRYSEIGKHMLFSSYLPFRVRVSYTLMRFRQVNLLKLLRK